LTPHRLTLRLVLELALRLCCSPGVGMCLAWVGVSRAVLWLVGFTSREVLGPFLPVQEPGAPFTQNPWLAVWAHWDTRWYLDIATRGYSAARLPPTGEANYAFFPLYPILMRVVSWIVGDPVLSGFLVSNVALVVATVLLYRLVADEHGTAVAERAVKYLLLFPTAFVLSGVLSEGLFLALSVGMFRAVQQRRWWLAGVVGGLAALTRPTGVLLALPLGWIYFAGTGDRPGWAVRVGSLLLVPAGLGAFAAFNWWLTGDPLAFVTVQAAWLKTLSNPVGVALWGLRAAQPQLRVGAFFSIATIALAFALVRTLGFPYFLVCLSAVLPPLAGGAVALYSMPRYAVSAWPLAVAAACHTHDRRAAGLLTGSLALLQGFLMVFWSNGSRMVI